MKHALVIVESPTKAKTIRKFLPKNFTVEASMGHVRDLPQSAADIPADLKKEAWAKLGVNVSKDFAPLYIIPKGRSKVIADLRRKIKEVDELYLATDEDREGESISWHLLEVLKPKIPVKRMVFHEITKAAIERALEKTRPVDIKLVKAQEARRILDRLVGYTLSPLIWKKIAYGLSAGRVQSVGVRLVVERERQRLRFKKAEFWDIAAQLTNDGSEIFEARLLALEGTRIATGKDFDEESGKVAAGKDLKVLHEAEARKWVEKLKKGEWKVLSVEEKPQNHRPYPPFITSTLQQEGNRKLGLSARDTMRVAQRLYEEGFITYMRTDSPSLSAEALQGARDTVQELYGKEYLSPEPRQFSAKGGAQEAHEAIRPAGSQFAHPKETGLRGQELALYELIWKRTVASQMAEARRMGMSVKIESDGATFAASGIRTIFPGYLRAYVEGSDDPDAALEDREISLPALKVGQKVKCAELEPHAHETKPPARFTEASLVQALEKESIGRPSTYSSIIGTILERGYARKVGNALVPTFTGFAVNQLLESNFSELVDLGFTAEMEKALDEIAEGSKEMLPYLEKFYLGKKGLAEQVKVKDKKIDPNESRSVLLPHLKGVEVRIGRFGPYIVKEGKGKNSNGKNTDEQVRASIPEDIAPADLSAENVDKLIEQQEKGPQSLGNSPETGEPVFVLSGRYGPYLQLGLVTEANPKPKRTAIPKNIEPKNITLDQALALLRLPRLLGTHPTTKEKIVANIGRFGPYVVHEKDFRSLKKEDDVLTVTLERALEIFAQPKRGRGGSVMLRDLGPHPADKQPVAIYDGRYGHYVKHGAVNAALPKGAKPEAVTLEEALALLATKSSKARFVASKGGTVRRRAGGAKAAKAKEKAEA